MAKGAVGFCAFLPLYHVEIGTIIQFSTVKQRKPLKTGKKEKDLKNEILVGSGSFPLWWDLIIYEAIEIVGICGK